jgi:hypothetical protein
MSMAMKSSTSAFSPTAQAPMTPPVGPDPSAVMARSATNGALMMPPFDCMMSRSRW